MTIGHTNRTAGRNRWAALLLRSLLIAGLACLLGSSKQTESEETDHPELLNVSYDPTRELYQDFDTAFIRHSGMFGFDAAVAMYHDQGLIALKTLEFDRAVNITLGLPIVRTSPDHGTAYDIAGTGKASPDSMIAAIDYAWRAAMRRQQKALRAA